MRKFTDNPRKNAHILREIDRREEKLVQMSRDLADKLAQIFENVEKNLLATKTTKSDNSVISRLLLNRVPPGCQ